jgi:hypothetical protein
MANSRLEKVVLVKFVARLRVRAMLYATSKQVANLSVHQDGRRSSTGFPEILDTEASIVEILTLCHHE